MSYDISQDINLIGSTNTTTITKAGTISTDTNNIALESADEIILDGVNAIHIEGDEVNSYAVDKTNIASGGRLTIDGYGVVAVSSGVNKQLNLNSSANAAGSTGNVLIASGDTSDAGSSGTIYISGGDAGEASGGDVTITGGASSTVPGDITIEAGEAAESDINGGDLTLSSGDSGTTSNYSTVYIKAANDGSAENYITLGGSTGAIRNYKDTTFDGYIGAHGRVYLSQRGPMPSPYTGELINNQDKGTLDFYDGSKWQCAAGLVYSLTQQSDANSSTSDNAFEISSVDITPDLPGDLQAGRVIKVRAGVSYDRAAAETITLKIYQGSDELGRAVFTGVDNDSLIDLDLECTIRTAGAGGTGFSIGTASIKNSAGYSAQCMSDAGALPYSHSFDTTVSPFIVVTGAISVGTSALYLEYLTVEVK